MTTDHDSDPDATVRMPRPAAPKKDEDVVELEVDPNSTLIREDWGSATNAPSPIATPEQKPAEPQQQWERTLRRSAYTPDQESH